MTERPTILCLASYFKGGLFLETCHQLGCHVILITEDKLGSEAWPRQAIDEFFTMPDLAKQPDLTYAVSYLARTRAIDAMIALDDYDVETVAALREHFRLPGMGSSAARLFRDKLAMRVRARERALPVPDFVSVLNHAHLAAFMGRVPPPWVLKPRAEAGSMGIKKVHSAEEVWGLLETLGDRQSFYLLEQFVPGDVYHVDSVVWDGEVRFAAAQRYGAPPMSVYQGGGVFVTTTLPYGGPEDQALRSLNAQVLTALGMQRGVSHAEFIRGHADGSFYFLECAARVGGAGVDKLVESATGLNPWTEWARLELATLREEEYTLPPTKQEYAGLMVTLARQEWPDTAAYHDPEIVWRMDKRHHVGMVVASPDYNRVQALVADYVPRLAADFTAVAAPLDRPPD